MLRDIIVLTWKGKIKSVKRSKMITQQLKAVEIPNIVAISVAIEHPKT